VPAIFADKEEDEEEKQEKLVPRQREA